MTQRRLDYVTEAFVACGLLAKRAHYHALLATTTFTGYHAVRRVLADEPAVGPRAAQYLDHLWRVLIPELQSDAAKN